MTDTLPVLAVNTSDGNGGYQKLVRTLAGEPYSLVQGYFSSSPRPDPTRPHPNAVHVPGAVSCGVKRLNVNPASHLQSVSTAKVRTALSPAVTWRSPFRTSLMAGVMFTRRTVPLTAVKVPRG